MKLNKTICVLFLALTGGLPALAQTNDAPGDTDYAAFSRFITQRNIFDPNRYPHSSTRPRRTEHHYAAAPLFTFVGAMSYDKGLFAFFSGNRDDLKKILADGGSVAGYSVTNISLTSVTLQVAGKPDVTLNVGDQMRYEDNGWQYVKQGDAFGGVDSSGISATTTTNSNSAITNLVTSVNSQTTVAPPVGGATANDILERLRKQREQEQSQ